MPRATPPKLATLPPPRWMRRVDTSVYTDEAWLDLERELCRDAQTLHGRRIDVESRDPATGHA